MPLQDSTPGLLVSEFCDDEDMADLLRKFLALLPERINAIEQAMRDQDLAALSSLAHQMKGVAGGYGFPTITDAAKHLEVSVNANESLETLANHTRVLADLCRRTGAGAVGT